jgi:hypothetical protein
VGQWIWLSGSLPSCHYTEPKDKAKIKESEAQRWGTWLVSLDPTDSGNFITLTVFNLWEPINPSFFLNYFEFVQTTNLMTTKVLPLSEVEHTTQESGCGYS